MNATRLVFSNRAYLLLSIVIFTAVLFSLLTVSGYVFLEPFLVGHVYDGGEAGLVLIVVLAGMTGLVLPMNVYRIVMLRESSKRASVGVMTSAVGSAAGACGCGSVGFTMAVALGGFGATAAAFLANYEMPIRLAAIALLAIIYVSTTRSLTDECLLRG